jgi:hypothetical protein
MKSEKPVRVEGAEFTDDLLYKLSVHNPSDAVKFLANLDQKKGNSGRLMAWLFEFGLLPKDPDQWPRDLTDLVTSYRSLVKKIGSADDLQKIKERLEAIIPRDLGRSLHLFDTYCKDVCLDSAYFSPPDLRFLRIFLVISTTDKDFQYLQGYDRFAFICAIVSCHFSLALGLKADIAEAFTFHLTHFITTKVAFSHLILDRKRSEQSFAELSLLLEKGSPATFSAFRWQKITPDVYALNWLLALFSDQHPLNQVFMIWDLIFLHLDCRELYVNSLCIAHLNQCQMGLNAAETVQRILKASNFDLKRLAEEADRISGFTRIESMGNEKRRGLNPGTVLLVILGVVCFAFFFVYWQLR